MWKALKIEENIFLTCFQKTDTTAKYILYDVAKNDVYAEIVEINHLFERAQKINANTPYQIDLPQLLSTLLKNETTFVNIATRQASKPYLSLCLQYPIREFNATFHWHMKPLTVPQLQELFFDPCLNLVSEMFQQMSTLLMALGRNLDRLQLVQQQHCQYCGAKNIYSNLVQQFDKKVMKEYSEEYSSIKKKAEGFVTLEYFLRHYRQQVQPTTSVTSNASTYASASSFNSLTEGESSYTEGESCRTDGESSRTDGESSRAEGQSNRTDGESSRTEGQSSRTTGQSSRTGGQSNHTVESSRTTVTSAKDSPEPKGSIRDKGLPVSKPATTVGKQSQDKFTDCEEETEEEKCLEMSKATIKTKSTEDAENLLKYRNVENKPIDDSKEIKTIWTQPSGSLFQRYSSSGKSSESESEPDEKQIIVDTLKKLPTALAKPMLPTKTSCEHDYRSSNKPATGTTVNRARAAPSRPYIPNDFSWAINYGEGPMRSKKKEASKDDQKQAFNREQYLRDRDRRWQLFEANRPISSDEYLSATSANRKTFGEVLSSFERIVDTRICTLNNVNIPHYEEDPARVAKCRESARRRLNAERNVCVRFADNADDDDEDDEAQKEKFQHKSLLSDNDKISSTCTLCANASRPSTPVPPMSEEESEGTDAEQNVQATSSDDYCKCPRSDDEDC